MPTYGNSYYPSAFNGNMYGSNYAAGMPMDVGMRMNPQGYSAAPQPIIKSMEWVEGEIGAKAFQIPTGWPANTPIPLWDSTDKVIYLKSVNQLGMPNPLQKLRYEIEETPNALITNGNQSGNSGTNQDMSQYVTKKDLDELRQEIRGMNVSRANQNGSSANRGGKE